MTAPNNMLAELASLGAAVEDGSLRLEPGVAEQCVAACEQFADDLKIVQANTRWMSTPSAYGILASAQTLGGKFEAKAIGANGLSDVLEQHIDTVHRLRDLFEKAARAYHEADARAAEMLVNRTDGP
ncbi:MAG TPA: hypothetical protein VIW24_26415 [Aldersonia sp.]